MFSLFVTCNIAAGTFNLLQQYRQAKSYFDRYLIICCLFVLSQAVEAPVKSFPVEP